MNSKFVPLKVIIIDNTFLKLRVAATPRKQNEFKLFQVTDALVPVPPCTNFNSTSQLVAFCDHAFVRDT